MLNSKMMPQKTYQELMDEHIGKIPIYTDDWTNYNPSDPGITILENLAGAQILQQNQMEEVSDVVKAKLLKLLGYSSMKGKGARVYLEPSAPEAGISLGADQKFFVGDMCYETTKAMELPDSRIVGVYGQYEDNIKDYSYILNKNLSMRAHIFGKQPKVGARVYIVMDKPLSPGEQGIIHIDVSGDYGRNPFAEGQKEIFAKLKWECYCQDGFVDMSVEDETVGFLVNGVLKLQQPQIPAARYEEGMINGYVWRATLEKSEYDVAPTLEHMSGFLFQVIQKETLAITNTFPKTTEVELKGSFHEGGYITVFAKEQKGSSYRKYDEYVDDLYVEAPKGRYYRKKNKGNHQIEFLFDKDEFGYAPANVKTPIKIVTYNEEIMKQYYLGEVYGYDNQEIELPVKHVVTETFCIIARREDAEGGYLYDFLKPNKMDEKKMSYYLYENEGKIVIREAGDYVGATLFIGSVAVISGEDGNIRKGNHFISAETKLIYTNPAKGEGGRYQESIEQVRRRFIKDLNTPQTAVIMSDYEKIIKEIPGLCIAKANAWFDDARNEVQIVVMPKLEQDFPKMSDVYRKVIEEYLDAKRLLSTTIRIGQPVYVPVNVAGKIYVKSHFQNCDSIIHNAIRLEVDYIHGTKNFGEVLRFDRIFHALDTLECVSYVSELSIVPARLEFVSLEGADLVPKENCLLYPGTISIEIYQVTDN